MQNKFENIESIKGKDYCIITNNNEDLEIFKNSGYDSVFSLNDKYESLLGDYIELIEPIKRIYLAFNELKTEKDISRRLGHEKCLRIDLLNFKNVSDYLKEKNTNTKSLIDSAKDVKVDGIFTVDDVRDSMLYTFKNGKRRGTTTYIKDLDLAWTWRGGEVNLWTGYQNEGKSLMLNQLCVIRAYFENAKVAVFSPENMPLDDFFDEIIEPFIGKSSDPFYKSNQMSIQEYEIGMKFAKENFFLIYPEQDFTLETIFEKIVYLVKKHGIKTVIIDPYNTIEHKMKVGEREDLYISRFMAKLKFYAVKYDLSINLVAHQLTARQNPNDGNRYYKPNLNNIKGGGTFADKADNVLFVWRPNRAIDFSCKEVVLGSQKIKKQKLVGTPHDINDIIFDIKSQRYLFDGFTPFTEIDRLVKEGNQELLNLTEKAEFDENGDVTIDYIANFDNEFPNRIEDPKF